MTEIFVANLGAYNAGIANGEWLDANQNEDDLKAAIDSVVKKLSASGDEYIILDSEGFYGFDVSKLTIYQITELAEAIEEHGEAVINFIEYFGEQSLSDFTESYCGEYTDEKDFTYGFLNGCYDLENLPEIIKNHIDYDALSDELFSPFFQGGYES